MRFKPLGRRAEKIAICLSALGLFLSAGLAAASAQASGAADSPSPAQDVAAPEPATSLAVSLDDIRRGLARGERGEALRGLNEVPHFKVEVVEQHRRDWSTSFDGQQDDYSSFPVPGGNYAYEIQRLNFPATRYPLAQPYAAFTQSELLQVSLTTMMQQLLTPKVIDSLQQAQRQRNKEAARAELERALQEYCAAQPNGGQGVFGCK